jgi:hypothetical protein
LGKPKKLPELVLGWVVDNTWQPVYWSVPGRSSGFQSESDLIVSHTENAAQHAVIIAQSGSGKSFFLGRLLEEILLRTKSRVVIFDPNSDFRRFSEIEPTTKWGKLKGESVSYPHEKTRRPFFERWKSVTEKMRLYVGAHEQGVGLTRIQFDWLEFSIDWFTDDTDPAFQSEMRHCHAFARDFFNLCLSSKTFAWREDQSRTRNMLEDVREFMRDTAGLDRLAVLDKLKDYFGPTADGTTYGTDECEKPCKSPAEFDSWLFPLLKRAAQRRVNVSLEVERAYFSIAEEEEHSEIFADISPPKAEVPVRVHVIDLPSIRDRAHRMMAVSRFLEREMELARVKWQEAMALPKRAVDKRVPTFIVVDEAHNLLGHQPDGRAATRLRDQFRTVAAEGRKFGVFLVLVTQRPDKLDPMAISECENRAIMRLNSEALVETTAKLLGLNNAARDLLVASQPLQTGRALLCGPWAKIDKSETMRMYGAMRRTMEGGKNLDKKYWTRPYSLKEE